MLKRVVASTLLLIWRDVYRRQLFIVSIANWLAVLLLDGSRLAASGL